MTKKESVYDQIFKNAGFLKKNEAGTAGAKFFFRCDQNFRWF